MLVFVAQLMSSVPLRIQGTSGKRISMDLQSCCLEITDLEAMNFYRRHFISLHCNTGVSLGLDASGYSSELLNL